MLAISFQILNFLKTEQKFISKRKCFKANTTIESFQKF